MNLFSQIGYVWENKRGGRERRMHLSSVCSKWIFDTACGLLLIAQITFCSAFTNSAYPSRITTVSIHFITRVDIHFQVSRQLVYCVLDIFGTFPRYVCICLMIISIVSKMSSSFHRHLFEKKKLEIILWLFFKMESLSCKRDEVITRSLIGQIKQMISQEVETHH